jgi:mannosyltransferase OCH1-like enzyme
MSDQGRHITYSFKLSEPFNLKRAREIKRFPISHTDTESDLKGFVNFLKRYNRNWLAPYITVMASTGPLFISLVWKEWLDNGKNVGHGRVRTLVPQGRGYGFFINVMGRSWQGRDELVIAWLEKHWAFTTFLATAAVVVVLDIACSVFDMAWKRLRRRWWIRGFAGR